MSHFETSFATGSFKMFQLFLENQLTIFHGTKMLIIILK